MLIEFLLVFETENFVLSFVCLTSGGDQAQNCPLCKCLHSPQSGLSAYIGCMHISVRNTIHSLTFNPNLLNIWKEDGNWVWVASWNLALELTRKQLCLNAYYSIFLSPNVSNTKRNPLLKGFHGILLTNLLHGAESFLRNNRSTLYKKFPTFYGTRRFITSFTNVHLLSLSWASSIHSIPPHPTSWRSILILSSHLRLCLQSCIFPPGFTHAPKLCLCFSLPQYALHSPPISFFSIWLPEKYWVRSTDH